MAKYNVVSCKSRGLDRATGEAGPSRPQPTAGGGRGREASGGSGPDVLESREARAGRDRTCWRAGPRAAGVGPGQEGCSCLLEGLFRAPGEVLRHLHPIFSRDVGPLTCYGPSQEPFTVLATPVPLQDEVVGRVRRQAPARLSRPPHLGTVRPFSYDDCSGSRCLLTGGSGLSQLPLPNS